MDFYYALTPQDLQRQAGALVEFCGDLVPYFRTQTRDVSGQALAYVQGQLLGESRRNMTQMATQIVSFSEQALDHFVSNSPWEEEPLIGALGQRVVALWEEIPGPGALLVDESGIPKQGTHSVGVDRQYCGSLGKVDNCQVGVFLAYAKGTRATLIDKRLYLPRAWTEDPGRCEEAGVPPEAQTFRTKAELGLEMILRARARGVPFGYVGMDAHYGQQAWLLSALDREQIEYMADIPSDTRVYLELPAVGLPPRKGSRGRLPKIPRVLSGKPIEVHTLLDSEQVTWSLRKVRDTQRGELWIHFAALRVYRIQEELPVEAPVWLLIRKDLDSSDVKFTFSSASPQMPSQELAQKQSTRYWVERSLEDGKGLAGLDEYQVIGWRGWHHHMTMVLLAMVFLEFLRKKLGAKAPLMTLQDAQEILEVALPRKTLSLDEAVEIIRQKHLNRYRSRESSLRKQQGLFPLHNL
jgi:SRSO17 transposase